MDIPTTEATWELDPTTRTVVLFGLGWAWIGFWPSLFLTVVGPGITARYWKGSESSPAFQQRVLELSRAA